MLFALPGSVVVLSVQTYVVAAAAAVANTRKAVTLCCLTVDSLLQSS